MSDTPAPPFSDPIASVLFVCLGNICRSPLAEGIFRHLARERGLERTLRIDSAGTGAWHVGNPPDPRSTEVAARHGIRLESRARQVTPGDATEFDLVLAMDRTNLRDLSDLFERGTGDGGRGTGGSSMGPRRAEAGRRGGTLRLFRDFDPDVTGAADVPDPYYGGPDGFETVHAMVERTCRALLDEVERSLTPGDD
jgi:protein-tyrosine phosphatase